MLFVVVGTYGVLCGVDLETVLARECIVDGKSVYFGSWSLYDFRKVVHDRHVGDRPHEFDVIDLQGWMLLHQVEDYVFLQESDATFLACKETKLLVDHEIQGTEIRVVKKSIGCGIALIGISFWCDHGRKHGR